MSIYSVPFLVSRSIRQATHTQITNCLLYFQERGELEKEYSKKLKVLVTSYLPKEINHKNLKKKIDS